MNMSKLTLTTDSFFISPYALTVFVALTEKKLPFELNTLSLVTRDQDTATFAANSLTARVPLLVHGDFALSESSAITEYLEEIFPAPAYAALYPKDLEQRARARQIQAWVRSDLMPIREQLSTDSVFYSQGLGRILNEQGQKTLEKLLRFVNAVLTPGQQNLFGQWCIADTDLAMMLMRLVQNNIALPSSIKTYAQQQWARPSVAEWVNQPRVPYTAY